MILGIYGAGGSGREIYDIVCMQNIWEKLVFIDDTVEEGTFKSIDRMPFERFNQLYGIQEARIIIAQGEPEYKVNLFNKVKEKGYILANIIHSLAYVSGSAILGEGVVVQANTYISCGTEIRDNVHIMQNSIIAHDCIIHEHCQISMGVIVGGCVEIGEKTYIGMNVSIRDRINLGDNSVVGMGANVLKSIPNDVVAFGNPAKVIMKKRNKKIFIGSIS
ncbi:acetyltransferase [Lachnospiraceae bacterium 56-18]